MYVTNQNEVLQRKMKYSSNKYNASGYLDLTAYHALQKIEREHAQKISDEKRKQKKKRRNRGDT